MFKKMCPSATLEAYLMPTLEKYVLARLFILARVSGWSGPIFVLYSQEDYRVKLRAGHPDALVSMSHLAILYEA